MRQQGSKKINQSLISAKVSNSLVLGGFWHNSFSTDNGKVAMQDDFWSLMLCLDYDSICLSLPLAFVILYPFFNLYLLFIAL